MSIIGSNILAGASGQAAGGGYAISRSLRFNSSDSAYLSRTPASAGNRKTWTWAGWVKKCSSKNHILLSCVGAQSDTQALFIDFLSDDTLRVLGWSTVWRKTTQVFRDPSAWYHIVVTFDSTQATAANRIKIYVNGSEVTTFSTNNAPAQNTDFGINQAALHEIGRYTVSSVGYDYFDGYLADIHFIDGQALDPTSFGEFSATTGVWVPKAYTGTYGTNGFHLDFADNSSNTATTLGKDTSGNGNNWTPNNLSVTAGAGNDSLVDVPTNGTASSGADPGGSTRGNYCTLNPLDGGSATTLSNGNLDIDHPTSTTWRGVRGTIGASSGKYYFEYTFRDSGQTEVGIANSSTSLTTYPGSSSGAYIIYTNGQIANNNSFTNYGSSLTTGDVLGVAVDLDNNKIWFSKNGAYPNSGDPAAGTNAAFTSITSNTYFPVVGVYTTTSDGSINFGQRPFAYTAPSGFKALCTANLPAPLVTKPSTVMDVKLYTGNASTQTISGLGFESDLLWFKRRDSANSHILIDQVRGLSKQLVSNATDAEGTDSTGLTAVSSTGFTLGAGNVFGNFNANGGTFAAWCWDAGSSTVTNTVGSISSQVRANASAGFSVVTYTSDSSAVKTVGHGLNVAPAMIIWKDRDAATNWFVFHNGGTPYMFEGLNTTAAGSTSYANMNSTLPTSSVFTLNSGGYTINPTGNHAMVAYCWAPLSGYSSFGSYTGNGSSDGPFVYTGFRPRWIMIKRTDSTFGWYMYDTARDTYNIAGKELLANESSAEVSDSDIDIISNGFKPRRSSNAFNASSGTFIYAAFAESPFNYARAR